MMVLAIERAAVHGVRIYIGQAGRLEQIAGARIRAKRTAQIVRRTAEHRRADRVRAAEEIRDLLIESG